MLKTGKRVQLKTKAHSFHTKHIVNFFTTSSQPEFTKDSYEEIALLLGSKARRTKLKGTVVGYGASDDDFKDGRPFLLVEFQWKGLTTEFYCSEKDLKKL